MAKRRKQTSNALEVQNAAKTLFANIRFMSPDAPIRSIVITSSIPNEGKSTVSTELAKAIATSGKTVLLVEADMRRRTLANLLNVHPSAGAYAVLTDAVALDDAVEATQTPNLFFLDVEPNIPNPADIISSKRYHKLVATLDQAYDYVIYDTPPVGTFVDAAILSAIADGTVLVVKPGEVKRDVLADACDQLRKADANLLGLCATFCEGTGSEYYYAYYTKDGERVRPGDADIADLDGAPAQTGAPTPSRQAPPVAGTAHARVSGSGSAVAAGHRTSPVRPATNRPPMRGRRPAPGSSHGRASR